MSNTYDNEVTLNLMTYSKLNNFLSRINKTPLSYILSTFIFFQNHLIFVLCYS